MALFRALAPAGYTFTGRVMDPVDYSVEETLDASDIDEIVARIYQGTSALTSGVHYIELSQGDAVVSGYANFDAPQDDGACEVFDTLEEANNAGMIAAIYDKTQLIRQGTVSMVGPVLENGDLRSLVIGEPYLTANGRQLRWTLDKPTGYSALWSAKFSGSIATPEQADGTVATDGWIITGAHESVDADTIAIVVEIAADALVGLIAGEYTWSAALFDVDGRRMTQVRNKCDRLLTLIESEFDKQA